MCELRKQTTRFAHALASRAIVVVIMLASGCHPPEARRLVGHWELIHPGSLAQRINQADDLSGNAAVEDRGGATGNFMVVQFSGDGALKTVTQLGNVVREKEGRWKLLAADPLTTRIAFTLAGDTGELAIEWIDNDTIKMVPPNMAGLTMKLTFRRRSGTN